MDTHLKTLFSRFHHQFGSGPGLGPGSGTCLTNIPGVEPPFIKSLYKAAAALYRSDPWRRLRPPHLLRLRVGKDRDWPGRKPPFPFLQFVGGDGGDVALHLFRSLDDAVRATGCRETVRVPNVEILRVSYEVESTMLVSNKRMVKSLGVERSGEDRFPVFDVVRCCSDGERLEFRNATVDELRFVYAVMRAVALVHPLLEEDAGAGAKYDRLARFQPLIETVDVQWGVEMSRGGNDLVAVTVWYPPDQGYEERSGSASSTPRKDSEGYIDDE